MELILSIWLGVALPWLLFSSILLACADTWEDKKTFSRGVVLFLVWPLVILYWIWLGLVGLWTMTDWDLKALKKRS